MNGTDLLTIDTRTGRALYRGLPLPISRHWVYLYGLLALRVLDGDTREVSVDEIRRLPSWTEVQPRSVATSLARHATTMQAKELRLITSPHGQRSKAVSLDPERVSRVRFDIGRDALLAWLNLTPPPVASGTGVEADRLLVLAETAFEQGMYSEAEIRALRALALEPSPDQHLRVLALVAWVQTINAPYKIGWATVKALQVQLAMFQQAGLAVDPGSEALVWIQTARFYMRKQRPQYARTAYLRAVRLLTPEHHREWGAVEAGLGYLAQLSGELDEAERRYRTALDRFSKGRWPWAMHVQYNNLAAVCFNLHVQLEDTRPAVAGHWLKEAVRWSMDAMEFAREMDYGGAVDLETNLAYAARLEGRMVEATEWLRRARGIVAASMSTSDLACIEAEQAELEEAQGRREAAVTSLRKAVALLHEVGTQTWTTAAEHRLDQLEGRLSMGKPLKLW